MNSIKENTKSFLQSPLLESVISKGLIIVGGIVIVAVIFLAGESVGYHKAELSYRFGENYNQIFGGSQGAAGMMGGFPLPMDDMFSGAHGAFGKIVKITLPHIIIADTDGVEKIITLDDDSIIKEFRGTISSSSLTVGDTITVLGSPDDSGDIVAKLIRLIPDTTATSSLSTSQ